MAYGRDAGFAELKVDGKIEFVTCPHCVIETVMGEIDWGVSEELCWCVVPGGDKTVPFRGAGIGAELEDAGTELSWLRVGELPETVNEIDGFM